MENKEPLFIYEMKVRDYECDAQGIVNNANYQHYYEVARHEFLESYGIKFYDLHVQGIDAIVSQVNIKYKSSLYGGDIFKCTVDFEKKGIRYLFKQKIIRVSDNLVCSEAVIEVVTLVNKKVSKPDYFDKIFGHLL